MNITKNQKIIIIKLMAQIVSTYHMIDVLSVYGPVVIACVAGFSLGLGEYMISQEYAIMGDNNKLKKLMLYALVGLSTMSALANIESFARYIDWSYLSGNGVYYAWFAGVVYSVSMPTVIVMTSFIRLKEPVKKEDHEPETEPVVETEKITNIRKNNKPVDGIHPDVLPIIRSL